MPVLNNLIGYASDIIVLAGAKAVEIAVTVGQAGIEIAKKVLLLG